MSAYQAPALTDLGSLHELTLSNITKTPGSGDFINGQPADGSDVISVS